MTVDDIVSSYRAGTRLTPDTALRLYADAPADQAAGAAYLRDNIKYHLGEDERAALELFYRYAVEAGVVEQANALRFY